MVRCAYFVWLLFAACVPSAWPKAVSAQQLEALLRSGVSSGLTDAQVAHSLADVSLTERLTEDGQTRLMALAKGPRTRDVIQILADVSTFVEIDGNDQGSNAPADQEQAAMLARAREYALRHISVLPDFVCTRVTRRFDDYPAPPGRLEVWQGLTFRDTAGGQLSYSHGHESYVDNIAEAGAPVGGSPEHGLSSFGEFGGILSALFPEEYPPQVTWGYWDMLSGRRLAVFHYRIAAEHSPYHISYCCDSKSAPVSVAAAYRGDFYIDPASGAIWRITRRTLEMPAAFPTRWVETIVDYRLVRIGGASYLCPVRSSTYSESRHSGTPRGAVTVRYLNETRFLHYRKFGAESRLVTGEAAEETAPASARDADEPEPWLELQPVAEIAPASLGVAAGVKPAMAIRISTQLVEVPVIVRDRRGVPIPGLKKDDFELYDNGKRQEARLFLAEEAPAPMPSAEPGRPAAAQAAGHVFSNAPEQGGRPHRTTIILVDALNTGWADLAYARQEIVKFLRQLAPGEQAGLWAMKSSGIAILAEHAPPGELANRVASFGDPQVSSIFNFPAGGSNPEDSLRGLTKIAERLAGIPGRKNVIWVSAGFPLAIMTAANQSESFHSGLVLALRAFNSANAAIYSVDAPGLQTAFADALVQVPLNRAAGARIYDFGFAKFASQTQTERIYANQESMLELSAGTGGRAFLNANDIAGAMQAAFDDPRPSYLLGFYPEAVNDGEYHAIRVAVAGRPELRVRYRAGYVDKAAPHDSKTLLRDALDGPADASGIPLEAQVNQKGARCEMNVRAGISGLALKFEGGRWLGRLEITVAERHDDSVESERVSARHVHQVYGLNLTQETYDRMRAEGFAYRYSFTPRTGIASVRVVVMEPASGTLGSVTIPGDACSK